ncbi:MAG: hypothetical protein LBT41_03440 [Candidatus Methanoplasma sp.]|jgi:DNA-directed RNA polymerase subunit RPC12/RpoP|nr:hypothetical protein [Candidatus Methanoplasma sp.]
MYSVVSCLKCRRHRIIDRSAESSACPYCGTPNIHKDMRPIFQSDSQNEAREVLSELSGFVPSKEPKQQTLDSDPLSTLVYRYETCRDPHERLELLAKGLTDIFGTFDGDDIAKVDPKDPEKLLKAMQDLCMAYEVRYGRYKA